MLTFGPFNSLGASLSATIQKQLKEKEYTGLLPSFFANAIGFGASAAITTPIDVIKTRIQVGAANPAVFPDRSIYQCAKRICREGGVRTLFDGAIPRVTWLGLRQGIAFTMFGEAYKKFSAYFDKKNAYEIKTQFRKG